MNVFLFLFNKTMFFAKPINRITLPIYFLMSTGDDEIDGNIWEKCTGKFELSTTKI